MLGLALGPLERRVMDVAWEGRDTLSVSDVQEALGGDLAYTTVMTTLDRLFKKGLLHREKSGRAFLYAPRQSRGEMESGLAGRLLESLLGGQVQQAAPVLSTLVDRVSERDRALLDELERLVQQKQQELGRRGGR